MEVETGEKVAVEILSCQSFRTHDVIMQERMVEKGVRIMKIKVIREQARIRTVVKLFEGNELFERILI